MLFNISQMSELVSRAWIDFIKIRIRSQRCRIYGRTVSTRKFYNLMGILFAPEELVTGTVVNSGVVVEVDSIEKDSGTETRQLALTHECYVGKWHLLLDKNLRPNEIPGPRCRR
jgi:hypothetical protein